MIFEIIAQPGGAPDAVLTAATPRLLVRGERVLELPADAVFDAKLSRRWDRIVVCTREFSAWWNARSGRPNGFFVTLLP